MANIETIGVKVVVSGADRAVSDLNKVNRAVGSVGGQAAATASPLGVLAGALGNVATIAAGIISAQLISRIAEGLKDMATGAILGAARVEELEIVMDLLGTRAGHATTQLRQWRDAVVDAGIRTDVATKLIVEFIRRNIDAAQATELAAVAQDAAVISMEDSTEALAGLLHGILTQRSVVLKHHGVIVDISQAFDDYSTSIGKNVDALTASDRVQAVLNAVLEEGVSITGAYEAAMTTAGKQLRSMPRFIYELLREMGTPFLQSFSDAIFATNEFIKALGVAVSEGGRLRPIIDGLAAAANRLLVPIMALAQVVSEWLGVTTKAADDTGKAVTEVAAKLATVKGPDLASAFEDEARKILDINKGLTESVTRMWEDFNRRLTQSTFDYNLGRLRDELDWARSQERSLEEHNRRMADLYLELEELRTGERRQEIKAGMKAERKEYKDQRTQLLALLGEAQSEEERLRIQGWVDALDAEHKANQDVFKEELDAVNKEQRLLELRIAQEEAAFKRRRAIEDEDRRIRLQREEEDWQRRTTRDEEAIKLREERAREEAAERITLVKAQIVEEKQARIDAYKEQAAALTESAETQKRILHGLRGEQKSVMDEWEKTIEGWMTTIKEIDWEGLAADVESIAQSLGNITGPVKTITGILTVGYIKGLITSFGGFKQVLEGTGEVIQGLWGVDIPRILLGTKILVEGAMITLIGFFGGVLQSLYNLVTGQSVTIVDDVVKELLRLSTESTRLSGEFMEGFIAGINDWWQRVIDRVRQLAEAIIYEIKLRLNMGSPSKAMFSIGQEISRSLAEGIRSLGDLPALQMGNVALGTLAAIPASTTTINQEYNLNMSSIAPVSTVAADFHLMKVVAGP